MGAFQTQSTQPKPHSASRYARWILCWAAVVIPVALILNGYLKLTPLAIGMVFLGFALGWACRDLTGR